MNDERIYVRFYYPPTELEQKHMPGLSRLIEEVIRQKEDYEFLSFEQFEIKGIEYFNIVLDAEQLKKVEHITCGNLDVIEIIENIRRRRYPKCMCCGVYYLTLPAYTYRGQVCVSKVAECHNCQFLNNEIEEEISRVYLKSGTSAAIAYMQERLSDE